MKKRKLFKITVHLFYVIISPTLHCYILIFIHQSSIHYVLCYQLLLLIKWLFSLSPYHSTACVSYQYHSLHITTELTYSQLSLSIWLQRGHSAPVLVVTLHSTTQVSRGHTETQIFFFEIIPRESVCFCQWYAFLSLSPTDSVTVERLFLSTLSQSAKNRPILFLNVF